MNLFEIQSGSGDRETGLIYFYEKSDTCIIELAPDVRQEEVPASLAGFVERGIRTLDPVFSKKYVEGGLATDGCSVSALAKKPSWMEERKARWLTVAVPLADGAFYLSFRDGKEGTFHLNQTLNGTPQILSGGRVLDFGYGAFLMSETLYAAAHEPGIRSRDLEAVMKGLLVDVPDLCAELAVSRQYVNRRISEEGVEPFRKCGGNNLYLRQQVNFLFDM